MKTPIFFLVGLACLLTSFTRSEVRNPYTKEQWRLIQDETIIEVCEVLDTKSKAWRVLRLDKSGELIKTRLIVNIVRDCFGASAFNPSWGGAFTTSRKLILACYIEGGFDPAAENKTLNRNKTTDQGIMQINTIHTTGNPSTFSRFCAYANLPFKPKDIWDTETNIYFGAYINELQIKGHNSTYKFYVPGRPDVRALYQALFQELPKRLKDLGVTITE